MTGRNHALITLATATATAALTLAACGGDDPETSSTEAETEAAALDPAAFEDCIFAGSLDVGIYEAVDKPDPALSEATEEAEFFEAGKGDDGIVAFYVFDDPAAAEVFAGEFEPEFTDFATDLAASAHIKGVTGSVETADSVVVGLIPFSTDKETELTEEALADVETCSEKSTA